MSFFTRRFVFTLAYTVVFIAFILTFTLIIMSTLLSETSSEKTSTTVSTSLPCSVEVVKDEETGEEYFKDRLIIAYKQDISEDQLNQLINTHKGIPMGSRNVDLKWIEVCFPDADVKQIKEELKADSEVENVYVDTVSSGE